MKAIISKCLLGEKCRYDGGSKPCQEVIDFGKKVEVIGVCPESEGGLACPRPPAEIQGDRVIAKNGVDVTAEFMRGACICCEKAKASGAPLAILKSKSPSCSSSMIYDGTYTATLIKGDGVFTSKLREEEICVVSEEMIKKLKPSVEHPVAIVLGSGLGHLADLVVPVRHIDYHDIDGFPICAEPVKGHKFEVTIGTIDEVPVVVYPGRIHLYHGYSASEVTSLVRHAHSLGCENIIFACATGAITKEVQGLGVVTDQINLTGHDPLRERDDIRAVETPFVGMVDAYTPCLIELVKSVAEEENVELSEGILAGTVGPSFETPAEVDVLRRMGASYVGMSCVCEVIMAHALGMNVLTLTQAGNPAGEPDVSHESILLASKTHQKDFEKLVRGVLRMMK